MTGPTREAHERWDELAAGYALHALEPQEEQEFTAHLDGCDLCPQLLAEHELVAAQLGAIESTPDADDAPPSWAAMRSAIVGTDTLEVVSLATRRRTSPRLLAAAAAVIVVAGVAVVTWQSTRTTSSPATTAIAACRQTAGCRVIQLRASDGAERAVVAVMPGSAHVVPVSMRAPARDRMYVLWQLRRSGGPMAVTSFRDVHHGATSTLPVAYADTAAFAVSVEPAGPLPAAPTQVVAVGSTA